jgi:WD40 repeat protein
MRPVCCPLALAQGAIRTMQISQWLTTALVVLLVGTLGGGLFLSWPTFALPTSALEADYAISADFKVNCIAVSPDGRFLAYCGTNNGVVIWDLTARKKASVLKVDSRELVQVAFSRDGKMLAASASDPAGTPAVTFWSVDSWKKLGTIPDCSWIAFSADSKSMMVAGGHEIRAWDISSKKQKWSVRIELQKRDHLHSLVASADGTLLAVATQRLNFGEPDEPSAVIVLWATNGKESFTHKLHSEFVNQVVFAPDSKYVASAGGGAKTTVICETSKGKPVVTLKLFRRVQCLCFTNDSKNVLIGTDDSGVHVLDVISGQRIAGFGGEEQVREIVVFEEGKKVAIVRPNAGIEIWNLEKILKMAKAPK